MRIPKKVKIGFHTFRVVIEPLEDNLMGYCDFHNRTIQIDIQLSQAMREETLLHEILHAIRIANGYDYASSRREEQFVATVSKDLYQVLKENKFL